MNTPSPEYLTALAHRVRDGSGISNALDMEIEIALFDPPEDGFVSVQPNATRTKLIYRRADGTTVTCRAHDWTMGRRDYLAAKILSRAEEIKEARRTQAPRDTNERLDAIESAIRIGIFNTCIQRGMSQDAATAIVRGTMDQLCVAAALAKGKEQ